MTLLAQLAVDLPDPASTELAGATLGDAWVAAGGFGALLALEGDLGAGKTTLMRGLLRGLGETGAVRSPTYTLVESYRLPGGRLIHHLDCYRIQGWDAAEQLGLRDLLAPGALVAVEWASRIDGLVARADLELTLSAAAASAGRQLELRAASGVGVSWLEHARSRLGTGR